MKWKCNDFKCIRKLTMHQANKSSGWAEFFLYNWNNYVAISRCNINYLLFVQIQTGGNTTWSHSDIHTHWCHWLCHIFIRKSIHRFKVLLKSVEHMRSVEIYYYASQSSHFENILQFCVQKIRNFGRDRRRRAALLPVRLPEDAVRTVSVTSIRVSAGIAFTVGSGHVIIHNDKYS